MWLSAAHLTFGNLFLGILEGALAMWWFRASPLRAFPSMIAANYISAWLGGYVLLLSLAEKLDITINNVWFWLWGFWIAAFVITCGLELPFVTAALWKRRRSPAQIVLACLLVNLVSYLILTGLYRGASRMTMVTKLRVVPIQEIDPQLPCRLFYITSNGKEVVESDLSGTSIRKVFAVPLGRQPICLLARPNEDGRYDLYLVYQPSGPHPLSEVIQKDFACQAPLNYALAVRGEWNPEEALSYYFHVPAMGEPSLWTYEIGFWPIEGIYATNRATGKVTSWAMETPWVQWSVRHAVQLDGDFLLFQLGRDQLCILDPQTRRIALIARGFGPLVAIKCPPNS